MLLHSILSCEGRIGFHAQWSQDFNMIVSRSEMSLIRENPCFRYLRYLSSIVKVQPFLLQVKKVMWQRRPPVPQPYHPLFSFCQK